MRVLTQCAAMGMAALMSWGVSFAGSAADDVMVMDPYVRAVPPGQPNSAAFMTLSNKGDQAHVLVGGQSSVAKVVELHTHMHKDGMMMMRQIDKIDVPASDKAVLKPGGLHIMLIGLREKLNEGDKVTVTLKFKDGSQKDIEAPVRKVMGGTMKNMDGMKKMDHKM